MLAWGESRGSSVGVDMLITRPCVHQGHCNAYATRQALCLTGFANDELTKMYLPVHLCSSESLSDDAEVQIPVREASYHLVAWRAVRR